MASCPVDYTEHQHDKCRCTAPNTVGRVETTMMAFEINGNSFHLRMSRGDCELRVGGWMLTVLWNGRIGDGGVFLQTRRGARSWAWDDLRGSFTSGREMLSAP